MDDSFAKSNSVIITDILVKDFKDGGKMPRKTQKAIERFNTQVAYEENFKEENRICHADGTGSILGISASDLSGIHKDVIIKNLKERFHDYNFMNEFRCMINVIIDMPDSKNNSERSKIHQFIESPKRFGAKSAYSYALRSDLKSSEDSGKVKKKHDFFKGDMVVIKCPREPSSSKELIHELAVGLRLFELRKYGCCNFSMVYDAWYCGAPVVDDKTNEVISWCMNSDNPVSYVAYENIQNAVPIEDIVKDISDDTAIKTAMYLMQIALALNMAKAFAGFQHYDAHTGNILLRNYHDDVFYIYYPFMGKQYYVPTPGAIATFIDYGMSRIIMEDGTSVGKLDYTGYFTNIGITPDDGDVISDLHKLICLLLAGAVDNKNEKLVQFLSQIIHFYFYKDEEFSGDGISYILNEQIPTIYHVPPKFVEILEWDIEEFIVFLNDYSKEVFGVDLLLEEIPENAKIFGNAAHFKDPEEIKEEIGLDVAEVPTLFDLAQDPSNKKILENVKKNINEILHNETLEIISILNGCSTCAFPSLDSGRKAITEELEYATSTIESVAKVVTSFFKISEKLKIYNALIGILDNKTLNGLVAKCQSKFDSNMAYIERIKKTLLENWKKIDAVMTGPDSKKEDDVLFNLHDKYKNTLSGLRSMSLIE